MKSPFNPASSYSNRSKKPEHGAFFGMRVGLNIAVRRNSVDQLIVNMDRKISMTPELRLLLSCARVVRSHEDDAAIGQMLDDGIDWTAFARKAIDHGLSGFVGHTLAIVAPDGVADDILDAFRMNMIRHAREIAGCSMGLQRSWKP